MNKKEFKELVGRIEDSLIDWRELIHLMDELDYGFFYKVTLDEFLFYSLDDKEIIYIDRASGEIYFYEQKFVAKSYMGIE